MKETVYLVEDDPQQSATIKDAIERRYNNIKVELLETESEFRECLDSLATHQKPPRLVICDVMLPWAFPAPNAPPPPPEVEKGTFREAGLRCWERFREVPAYKEIPWIYFTVLDVNTIDYTHHSDGKTGYSQKSGSLNPLFVEIEEFEDQDWKESAEEVSRRLLEIPKMRKILVDGLNTPLSECVNVPSIP
jgi:CheY-like chemotaxis protein